jgi:hypothetical protein
MTTKQTAEMLEKRTKLGRYLARFRTLQAVYSPAALQALAEQPEPAPGKDGAPLRVENVPLLLPSALTQMQREAGCFKNVTAIEERLRDAQCRTGLEEIRSTLHVKSRFRTYKGGQVRHQGATTRSRNLMNRNDARLRLYAEKYIAAWEAKRSLAGENGEIGWKRLNPKKDLRCMDSEEDRAVGNRRKVKGRKRMEGEAATAEDNAEGVTAGQRRKGKTGEGRRVISWIWMGADTDGSATDKAVLTSTHSFLMRKNTCR